jgi:hypothetical protein
MLPAAIFFHSAIVFRAPKLIPQSFRSTLSKKDPRSYACNHNHDKTNDQAYD